MTKKCNTIIYVKRAYSRKECAEMFGRGADNKHKFEYIRYTLGAKFVLGPGTQGQKWNTKYFILGADLYRFLKDWRPDFAAILTLKGDL